jgi:tetratricopeptide (TPR) repeat protein
MVAEIWLVFAMLSRDPAAFQQVVQCWIDEGRYAQALPVLEAARAAYPDRVETLNQLGGVYNELGRLRDAQNAFEQAREIDRARGGVAAHDLALTLNNLGLVYTKLHLLHQAEETIAEAAAIHRQLGDSLGEAQAALNLGSTYRAEHRFDEAEIAYRSALEIRERMLAAGDRNIAIAANNLGVLLTDLKRWDEAAPMVERALGIWEKTLGASHPMVAAALNNLGVLYLRLGRFDRAEAYLARAVKIGTAILPANHPDLAAYMYSYSIALKKLDRKKEAKHYQEAARLARENFDHANALGLTVDARQSFR